MKEILTALITPFYENGEIDFVSLRFLVEEQIEKGIDGFIVCGTTAETPALSDEEQDRVIQCVISQCKGRCKVYAGAGTNCTATTIAKICRYEQYDLDGYLLVTPYYNRPSEEGLFLHFKAVSAVTKRPIILYHIPSRCGVSISVDLLKHLLSTCDNIIGLKYAANDYQSIMAIKQLLPSFLLYSGDDISCFNAMRDGFDGVISVLSHLQLPNMRLALKFDDPALIDDLQRMAAYCFIESSPAPVKYMLSTYGLCMNVLRLPLCSLSAVNQSFLDRYAIPLNDKLRNKDLLC